MRGVLFAICLAAGVTVVPSHALGDCEPMRDGGWSFGARAAYAFPIGAVEKSDPLSSNFAGMVPLWLDAGYRPSRFFYVGPYFQWAPAFVAADVCPGNLSCSAYGVRLGLNVHWHFKSASNISPYDPWVGIGTGYESATLYVSTPSGAKSHETNSGYELANLQLGFDHVGSALHLGVFTMISLSEFSRQTHTTGTTSQGFAIPEPRLHGWFSLGLRGQYDL